MSMFFKVRGVGHYSESYGWDDGLSLYKPVYISPSEIELENQHVGECIGMYHVSTDRSKCGVVQQAYVNEHAGWRSVDLIVKAMGICDAMEKAREFADAMYPCKGC